MLRNPFSKKVVQINKKEKRKKKKMATQTTQ
jgi:hypothetical protein